MVLLVFYKDGRDGSAASTPGQRRYSFVCIARLWLGFCSSREVDAMCGGKEEGRATMDHEVLVAPGRIFFTGGCALVLHSDSSEEYNI